jgi:hypothetical protein
MPTRFPIFQFPNRPMIAALATRAAARGATGDAACASEMLSHVALLAWAYGEVSDGANWFRRLLGLGGGAYAVKMLAAARVNHSTS